MIHTGDCVEVMRGMEADSVDAVVTDPPAGIAFMSKHWDRDKGGRTEWVAWMTEVMRECYRVLKPGGYAVVWSLPRTCHWTAWAMEDAGFIIRDQLAHVFASGFPKGKAQLKPAREDWWLARKPGPLQPLQIDECRIGTAETLGREKGGWGNAAVGATNYGNFNSIGVTVEGGRWPSNLLLSDPELFDEPNPYVVGSGATTQPWGSVGKRSNQDGNIYGNGRGLETDEWDGQTASYADSGGYSRFFAIPRRSDTQELAASTVRDDASEVGVDAVRQPLAASDYPIAFCIPKADRADREPIVRGSVERAELQTMGDGANGHDPARPIVRENSHPTVKPTDLMRHLVRLVTPPGGTVLDCFAGSGSTLIAAELEGFPWIGIEKEPEYVAIAEARLNGTQRGLGLDVPAPTKKRKLMTEEEAAAGTKRYKGHATYSGGWGWETGPEEAA